MAKKRNPVSRKSNRRTSTKSGGGFSLVKFTLGLLILVGLGYGYLAIQEGRLVPDAISGFELSSFSSEERPEQQNPKEMTSLKKFQLLSIKQLQILDLIMMLSISISPKLLTLCGQLIKQIKPLLKDPITPFDIAKSMNKLFG